jgi:cation diffusion facilitator CzcD-associated flavoprotein CzcO
MTMPQPTIAVIGAGFSGTALSLWLQSSCPVGTRIYLIERGHRFAAC